MIRKKVVEIDPQMRRCVVVPTRAVGRRSSRATDPGMLSISGDTAKKRLKMIADLESSEEKEPYVSRMYSLLFNLWTVEKFLESRLSFLSR